jgi:rod shape-determining protein MreB
VNVSSGEIERALSDPVQLIVQAVLDVLETIAPELSADICDRGLTLTGGGALLKNFDKRLRDATGLPVLVADNPLTSVVLGAGKMLSDDSLLRRIALA